MPIRPKNADVRTREYLTDDEVQRLAEAAKANRHGQRDATMILVAYRLHLALIGCITYEFSFAPGMHQTSLIYRIWKKTRYAGAALHDDIANAEGAIRPQGTIEQSDMAFLIGSDGTGSVD